MLPPSRATCSHSVPRCTSIPSCNTPTTSCTSSAPASTPETPLPVFSPNRLVSSGTVVAGTVAVPARLTARALAAHDRRTSAVHPFLHDFTSPIGERPRIVLRPRTALTRLARVDIVDGQRKRWYTKRRDGDPRVLIL